MERFTFCDLDAVTDDVHALFDGWDDDGRMGRALDPTGALVLRLAVHEWVANLVQHAYFRRAPRIVFEVSFEANGVAVAIEDSSEGFDFAQQLGTQRAILSGPAPSERGRGLLMLITCADDVSFRPASDAHCQRIGFAIRPPHDDVSFASLFRQDDLSPEPGAFDDGVADDRFDDAGYDDAGPGGDGAAEPLSAPPSDPTDR